MKIETLTCPECGENARGSIERLAGCAEFTEPDENGNVEYAGETDVWWDEQTTETDDKERWHLICPNAHQWFSVVSD